jgi:transcriptional regulator with XRE-family HTH domain
MRDDAKEAKAFRRRVGRAAKLRLGQRMKKIRLDRDVSQEALAGQVATTTRHIGSVERGRTNVSLELLAAIAARLSVGIGDLVGTPSSNAKKPPFDVIMQRERQWLEEIVDRLRKRRAPRRRAKAQ